MLLTNIRVYDVWRSLGPRGASVAFHAQEFYDYYPTPLTAESFTTGESDYDTPSDTIYCPCGEMLAWDWPHSVGGAVEVVEDHIRRVHPEARRR